MGEPSLPLRQDISSRCCLLWSFPDWVGTQPSLLFPSYSVHTILLLGETYWLFPVCCCISSSWVPATWHILNKIIFEWIKNEWKRRYILEKRYWYTDSQEITFSTFHSHFSLLINDVCPKFHTWLVIMSQLEPANSGLNGWKSVTSVRSSQTQHLVCVETDILPC